MTPLEIASAIAAIAMMLAAPFVLIALASRLRELPPHVRQALDSSVDAAGADEGGVAR